MKVEMVAQVLVQLSVVFLVDEKLVGILNRRDLEVWNFRIRNCSGGGVEKQRGTKGLISFLKIISTSPSSLL